jgi:hypothetical protein
LIAFQAVQPKYAPLNSATDNSVLDNLRQTLLEEPLRIPLKLWISKQPRDAKSRFAWFVMLPDGLQVARNEELQGGENTIGRNYSWRAYFHGGERDWERMQRTAVGAHIQTTHLSPPTFTQYTDEWVLVITAPIKNPTGSEPPLGILGLMLKMGSFLELPGNSSRSAERSGSRFAVLIDSREAHQGQILQHPDYAALGDDREARIKLLDESQNPGRRVTGDWNWHDNYPDPLAKPGSAAAAERWLASRLPVKIGGESGAVEVIVQENYDQAIGRPLAELRRGLIVLSLITFALSAAAIVPLWGVILRLVR